MRKELIVALYKITATRQKYIDEAAWDRCKSTIQTIKDLVDEYNEELNRIDFAGAYTTNEEINKELSELIEEAGRNRSIRTEIKRILTPVLEDVTIDWPTVYDCVQHIMFHGGFSNDELMGKFHQEKYNEYVSKLSDILGFEFSDKKPMLPSAIIPPLIWAFDDSVTMDWLKRYSKPEYRGKELPKRLKLNFPSAMEILEELD